jgi:hypothetical protein
VERRAEQLVLWPLVAEGLQTAELALEDLEPAEALEKQAREWAAGPDVKVARYVRFSRTGNPAWCSRRR